MQKTMGLAAMWMLMVGGVPEARAQVVNWQDRGFVNVNVGGQTQSHDFDARTPFPLYGETGIVEATHEIGGGAFFDISGGVRLASVLTAFGGPLWRNVGIGIGYSRFQNTDDVTVRATLPHPQFFDRPRSASTEATGLEHSESAVHVFGLWMFPLSDKIDLAVFLGPSFYSVKQDIVTDVQIPRPEVAPFPPILTGVTRTPADENAVGVNFGVDWSYLVTPQVGGGVFLRYSRASVDLPAAGADVSTDVGGFQIGVGLRARF